MNTIAWINPATNTEIQEWNSWNDQQTTWTLWTNPETPEIQEWNTGTSNETADEISGEPVAESSPWTTPEVPWALSTSEQVPWTSPTSEEIRWNTAQAVSDTLFVWAQPNPKEVVNDTLSIADLQKLNAIVLIPSWHEASEYIPRNIPNTKKYFEALKDDAKKEKNISLISRLSDILSLLANKIGLGNKKKVTALIGVLVTGVAWLQSNQTTLTEIKATFVEILGSSNLKKILKAMQKFVKDTTLLSDFVTK
jgi:hypothetical protein